MNDECGTKAEVESPIKNELSGISSRFQSLEKTITRLTGKLSGVLRDNGPSDNPEQPPSPDQDCELQSRLFNIKRDITDAEKRINDIIDRICL